MADDQNTLPKEIWKPVVGQEGVYEVSSLGRIKSLPRVRYCGNGRSANVRGGILRGYVGKIGYRVVTFGRPSLPKYVHRIVCEAFHGPAPADKTQVAHYDGNKENNSASNLRWADFLDNRMDGLRLGEIRRGQNHPSSKLSMADVENIRSDVSSFNGARGAINKTAKKWGLHRSHVRDIVTRRIWNEDKAS